MLRAAILLLVVALASCTSLSNAEKETLSAAAADIAGVKNEAEQWAHRIKGDYEKGSEQYETAYTKYIPAKAAVDAWLAFLATALDTHQDISSSPEYQTTLRNASAEGEEFIRYASGLYVKALTGTSSPLVNLLGPLTDAGLKIWGIFNAASKEAIDEVKKTLQLLKWKSFDNV